MSGPPPALVYMSGTVCKVVVQGIVVARHSAGEGSARVLIYTDALGLVSALATSAREERSQLRSHLQAGTQGAFSLVRGRDVWRVTGALHTKNVYFIPGVSSAQRESASRVLSFIRQFVRGEGSDPYLFETLSGFFASFPYDNESLLKDAECVAILRMLSALGYVEAHHSFASVMSGAYDTDTLVSARAMRPALVQAINEGISVSGLSS